MTTAIHQQKLGYSNRKSERQQQLDGKLAKNNASYQEEQAAIQANRDAMRRTLDEDRQRRDKQRERPNATIEAKKAELASKSKELADLSKRAKNLSPIPYLSLPEFQSPNLNLPIEVLPKYRPQEFSLALLPVRLAGILGRGVRWNEPPELPKRPPRIPTPLKSREPVRLHHDDRDYRKLRIARDYSILR